jgi:hypothetical protein
MNTETLEFAIIDRENGYIHLRAGEYMGGANGLYPRWDGAGYYHRVKQLCTRMSFDGGERFFTFSNLIESELDGMIASGEP